MKKKKKKKCSFLRTGTFVETNFVEKNLKAQAKQTSKEKATSKFRLETKKIFRNISSKMDAADDGRARCSLRGRLDTGGECEGETAANVAHLAHRLPDEFHSPLRCARTEEQMEPPQRDHESHRSEASGILGQNHPELPHG